MSSKANMLEQKAGDSPVDVDEFIAWFNDNGLHIC